VSERAARSRELVAAGYRPAVVARVAQISRQALYKPLRRRPVDRPRQRRPALDPIDRAIVEVARMDEHATDGYRMIAALVVRRLGVPVNRKRVLRVLREHGLIQRRRPLQRRRRPGFFRVERPDQLWHLDQTSIWVAEHGWCPLMAMIDCCTRELVGWSLTLRGRAQEAEQLIRRALLERGVVPGTLTIGTDNGSAFTSRLVKATLTELGVNHRRGGYRDPESQAFIESWFGKLKEREVWRNEYETLEHAIDAIARYVERYHHRPHSLLGYRTPLEVAQTWREPLGPHTTPA